MTSACKSIGIEELFVGVGCKFLDPNYKEDENKKPEVKIIEEPKLEEKKEENNVVTEEKKENKMHNSIKLDESAMKRTKKKKKFC